MIKTKEFTCDHIGYAPIDKVRGSRFYEQSIERIKQIKESNEWKNKAEYPMDDWYKGSRYADNDRLIHVIMCNAIKFLEIHKLEEDVVLTNMLEYFRAMSRKDFDKWISAALRYSGSADWWYRFEKDWN